MKKDKGMNNWFLIYCKPKQDARAEENLTRQGFDVFRPTINLIKSKIGCSNSVKCEPLFPRYLFINVDPSAKSIAPVLSTYGVVSFVKFGDVYATASDELIGDIKEKVNNLSAMYGESEVIKTGEEVYVDGHGFDHVKAIYCNPCGNERAMILMNILGKESKLLVPEKCLSRLN